MTESTCPWCSASLKYPQVKWTFTCGSENPTLTSLSIKEMQTVQCKLNVAKTRIEELEKALKFYANEDNYYVLLGNSVYQFAIQVDSGHMAKYALAKEPPMSESKASKLVNDIFAYCNKCGAKNDDIERSGPDHMPFYCTKCNSTDIYSTPKSKTAV